MFGAYQAGAWKALAPVLSPGPGGGNVGRIAQRLGHRRRMHAAGTDRYLAGPEDGEDDARPLALVELARPVGSGAAGGSGPRAVRTISAAHSVRAHVDPGSLDAGADGAWRGCDMASPGGVVLGAHRDSRPWRSTASCTWMAACLDVLPLWAAKECGATRAIAVNALPVMPSRVVRTAARMAASVSDRAGPRVEGSRSLQIGRTARFASTMPSTGGPTTPAAGSKWESRTQRQWPRGLQASVHSH